MKVVQPSDVGSRQRTFLWQAAPVSVGDFQPVGSGAGIYGKSDSGLNASGFAEGFRLTGVNPERQSDGENGGEFSQVSRSLCTY